MITKENQILRISVINSILKSLDLFLIFFMALHFTKIGLSGAEIGMIFAVTTITGILTILPSGFSNDRFNSKHLITIGLILMGIQYVGMAFAQEFASILVLFLFGRIGKTIYKTSMESLFYKTTEKEKVSKKVGIFHSMGYLSHGAITILGGYLLSLSLTFENIFLAIGAIHILFVFITQSLLPTIETTELKIIHYKNDIRQPKVMIFLLIILFLYIHVGGEMTSYSLFLQDYLELNRLEIGTYMGTAILIMAIAVKVFAKKMSVIGPKNMLMGGLFLGGIGHILMVTKSVPMSFFFRVVHEIGDAAIFLFLAYGITKIFDLSRVGGNNGIIIFVSTIGSTIGALIFGPMGEHYGYEWPLIIGGITTLIALLITIPYSHHFQHE